MKRKEMCLDFIGTFRVNVRREGKHNVLSFSFSEGQGNAPTYEAFTTRMDTCIEGNAEVDREMHDSHHNEFSR
jgi:hypothetical protein